MWCLLWQCSYGVISIILYGIVVWLVIREKRFFCSSFIKLTITLSVVNVITWITFFFLLRIPNHVPENSKLGIFLENFPCPILLRVGMLIGFYLGYCQHLSLFFTIFHRMRAITWPFDREAIWDTQYWITVLFICLFPLAFTFTLLQIDVHFIYKDQIGGYVLEPFDVTQISNVMQLAIFGWIITILGVVANATTIVMLCKRSMSSNYRRELHLFLISFVGFTVQALQSAVAFGYYVSEPESSLRYFCIFILPYCNDLFSLGLPYFFLVFNVRLRKCFFELPPFKALTQNFSYKCDKSCQHLAPSDAEASVVMV